MVSKTSLRSLLVFVAVACMLLASSVQATRELRTHVSIHSSLEPAAFLEVEPAVAPAATTTTTTTTAAAPAPAPVAVVPATTTATTTTTAAAPAPTPAPAPAPVAAATTTTTTTTAAAAAPVVTEPKVWLGANTTIAPAVAPSAPVAEPVNSPITPSPASTIASANNDITTVKVYTERNITEKNPGLIRGAYTFDPSLRKRRDQPRKIVGNVTHDGEVSVQTYTQTFSFRANQNSEGYTIETHSRATIEELAEKCFNDVRCTGFNSIGELKSFVRPAAHWVPLDVAASNTANTDTAAQGLYFQPQWYRFQPVPCPCDAEVPLSYVCSDPVSGDQFLGDALSDRACYRKKPAPTTSSCPSATCVRAAWKVTEFDACPSCGQNITLTRSVTCATDAGAVLPNRVCRFLSAKPVTSHVCNSDVACAWKAVDGPCKVGCGRGFLDVAITCTSPADSAVVKNEYCSATTKPKAVKSCKSMDCVWNTVPDGKCSFACGPGFKQLKATCIEPGKPDVVFADKQCAGVTKPPLLIKCNNRECSWETKPTSPCSQPCGLGSQSVRNTCRDPLTGSAMPAKQCVTEPPPLTQACSVKTCVWETTPFGGCSTTCGKGVQHFNVTCREPTHNHRVADVQCKSIPPPAPQAPCENNACGWRVRPIGECSASCGAGTQSMKVTCEDPITGALLPESQCGPQKPSAIAACHVRECHWHRQVKGKCSSPCGPGVQAFKLKCLDPETGKVQLKKQCLNVPVPALSEPCEIHACEWRARNEGSCSQICGPGRQRRDISCHDPVGGARVSSEHCTAAAPERDVRCYSQACIWNMKATTSCSASCGPGTLQVNVTCTDPKHTTLMPDSQCFDASKPNTTQVCNLQDCAWASTPASACSTSCGKGTQKQAVTCKDPSNGVSQADSQCDAKKKPADESQCFLKPCTWVVDVPPGKCSQVCGPGHVQVNVTCANPTTSEVFSDKLCPESPKPRSLRPCELAHCQWKANWTECDQKCGGGFQFSTLTCASADGATTVSNTQCKRSPKTWRQCNTAACTDVPEAFLFYNFEEEISANNVAQLVNKVSNAAKYGLNGIVQGVGAGSTVGRGGFGRGVALLASEDHTKGASIVVPSGKQLTSAQFSLSLWVKLLAAPTPGRFYILLDNRGTRGGGEGFVLYLDPRDGLVYLNDAYSAQLGKSHFADSGAALPNDGSYHHLSVTYNEKLVRFYIDGKQTSMVDPSHAFKFTVNISAHNVYLRGSPDAYWRVLPMALDQFAYFDYALASEQVALLAQPDLEVTKVCAATQTLTGGGCSKLRTKGDALNAICSKGAPFDLQKCLQPLWGLNGCSTLGGSFPTLSDAPLWNNKTWGEIKRTVGVFALRDREPASNAGRAWGVCKNRKPSGLDNVCDHPPPYHTNICLQALWLESGCNRKGSGWPASASHPLTRQLNELSWRDVRTKVQNIAAGDIQGGPSAGMCHGPISQDFDTQN